MKYDEFLIDRWILHPKYKNLKQIRAEHERLTKHMEDGIGRYISHLKWNHNYIHYATNLLLYGGGAYGTDELIRCGKVFFHKSMFVPAKDYGKFLAKYNYLKKFEN